MTDVRLDTEAHRQLVQSVHWLRPLDSAFETVDYCALLCKASSYVHSSFMNSTSRLMCKLNFGLSGCHKHGVEKVLWSRHVWSWKYFITPLNLFYKYFAMTKNTFNNCSKIMDFGIFIFKSSLYLPKKDSEFR